MPEESRSFIRIPALLIFLAMLGLMTYSVSAINISELAENSTGLTNRQIAYGSAGIIVFIIFAFIVPFQKLGQIAYPMFVITLGLLVLVLFLPPMKGQKVYRWIDLKIFNFQPSELAKFAQIVLLAWYLRQGNRYRTLLGLIIPFGLTLVPMYLILREPDLGTALLFLPILYVMLFMAGAKLRHLLGIVAIATAVLLVPFPRSIQNATDTVKKDRLATCYWASDDKNTVYSAAALSAMKPHQLPRITGWLQQDSPDVFANKGFQLNRSKVLIASGRITGHGDWKPSNEIIRRLPENHTDFIFSIIAGQWGLLGCLGLFLLYILIFIMGLQIASKSNDAFGRLLAVGMLGLIGSQLFINVGMTMGMLPITGMTLPLVSYGGSSLLVNCAALGVLVSVGSRKPLQLAKLPFEHKEDTSPAPYSPLETSLGPRRYQ